MAVVISLYAFGVLPALAVYIASAAPIGLFLYSAVQLGIEVGKQYEESLTSSSDD